MLAKIVLELKSNSRKITPDFGSIMQGVLMENISMEYAEQLHEPGYHPYSQFLECGQRIYWHIAVMGEEPYEKLLLPLAEESFQDFHIRKKNMFVEIIGKEVAIIEDEKLFETCVGDTVNRKIVVRFVSSTAFKNGQYYNVMPSMELLYRSIMKKYVIASNYTANMDEELLSDLIDNTIVTEYKLSSKSFALNGKKVPGFLGTIVLDIKGSEALLYYARFLWRIAEYSGIGIKCGIGMGGVIVDI